VLERSIEALLLLREFGHLLERYVIQACVFIPLYHLHAEHEKAVMVLAKKPTCFISSICKLVKLLSELPIQRLGQLRKLSSPPAPIRDADPSLFVYACHDTSFRLA